MVSPVISLALTLLAGTAVYVFLYVGRREKHLPPGPPTLPVLGNITQIPKKGAHFQFTKWAKQYGGIYSLKLGTGTAVVLTDRRLVKELIEKRSIKYSGRPRSYVANLISSGNHILLMDYGAQWRDTRKMLHATLMERMVVEHHVVVQQAEASQMIRDYLLNPADHMLHPKRFSNSVAMSLLYGVRTPSAHTSHMQRLYDLMEIWSKVMETGATPPVDVYPLLHWLPQSVFLNWIDRAVHVQKEMNLLYSDLLKDIRKRRSIGGSRGSFMDQILDQAEGEAKKMGGLSYDEHQLGFIGGSILEGGSDTSGSIVTAFVQAMATHPEIQKKAQAEIDSVMGEERSPTWDDYSRLPYVSQCVKETMRWRPVTPLAFPHALTEDDWVDQYFLPKGTVVVVNSWGLHNDPERFPNPEKYDPDHFKGKTTLATELSNGPWQDRDHYGYGAGRRFCPGAHLAERNLFIAMSKLLWAFDITPGKVQPDVDPRTGYSEGFLVCVNDFEADFKVRGGRRETILEEFEKSKSVYERFAPCGSEVA